MQSRSNAPYSLGNRRQAAAFPWPNPDWFDYDAVPAICARYPQLAVATGNFFVQDFINRVALGRGVEQVLMDIAEEDPVYLSRGGATPLFPGYIERILAAGCGRIDLVLCGDDFGATRSADFGRQVRRLFAPQKKEFFDIVHCFGAKVTHHCCGSSRALIPQFLACGMDALQTIQPQAAGMDPYELKGVRRPARAARRGRRAGLAAAGLVQEIGEE